MNNDSIVDLNLQDDNKSVRTLESKRDGKDIDGPMSADEHEDKKNQSQIIQLTKDEKSKITYSNYKPINYSRMQSDVKS